MASSCVCALTLRRILHPPNCLFSFPSIFARSGHVATSEESVRGADVAAKRSAKSGSVGQEDKRAVKDLKNINVWAPDPVTGYYRPIDQETEAQENALNKNIK